jgi:dTDP-4-amino-4,6-dideoxygalactose transaminase
MTQFRAAGRTAKPIPVLVPIVPRYRSLKKYLKRIDEVRTYSNFGPLNDELINRLSVFLNVPERNIQTAANATLALEGAIRTSETSKTMWELPSWTFVATAHSARNAGVSFSFVDVSADSWRAEFSDQIKNVIDVLPFGDTLDLERIPTQIEAIVVDGAASIAALRNCGLSSSRKFGVVVSLHATKSLPAGEGAFFFTNSESWSKKFRQWTNFGFENDRNAHLQSTNAKLSEYGAAVALASLDQFEKTNNVLSKVQKLATSIGLELGFEVHPAMQKGHVNPYWIAKFKSDNLKEIVVENFNSSKIGYRDWWGLGSHTHSVFTDIRRGNLANTELLAKQTLGLPFHGFLSKANFASIYRVLFSSLASH